MRIQDIVDLANARSNGFNNFDAFDPDEFEQEEEEQKSLRERLAERFLNEVNQRREYDDEGSLEESDEEEVSYDEA